MTYSKIISTSEAKYSIDSNGVKVLNGGTTQSSYNLPSDFFEDAKMKRVLVEGPNFNYARKNKDGNAYLLADNYRFKLGEGVLGLIGNEYREKANKFIGSVGYQNKKFQLFRKVYIDLSEVNRDEYSWFVELYDTNLTGKKLILDINDDEKILTLDVS